YRALIDETVAQWHEIEKTGLKVEFIKGGKDPYGNPRKAILDVVNNNHLWVFPTDAGFGGAASADVDVSGNPLLEKVPGVKIDGREVRANDLFRIVHDYFGHIKEGNGFRADGEENAWRIHSAMYSPIARRAMTTETRGQNSWVNFGPFGEKNRTASGEETEYAPQKIGLLPDWVLEEGRTFEQAATVGGYEGLAPFLTDDEKFNLKAASKAKILAIIETLPDAEEMAAVALAGRAKRGWYENSAQAILDVFGADAPRFAALLAAFSPQTSVEDNLINALNIWTGWNDAGRPTTRREIVKIMGERTQGNKGVGSLLDAWINNGFTALTVGDPATIQLSGPKVDSFMNNLVGVVDEVTNDAWMAHYAAVDQALFRPRYPKGKGSRGIKGPGYKAMNAVVREAADILTRKTGEAWSPAEVQETVWSFAKTLYETRDAAGENRSMKVLLAAGGVTHNDIANTPDFAVLFSDGVYKTILEEGGYGQPLNSNRRAVGVDGSQSIATLPEGSGFTEAAFQEFLGQAAARLEQVRNRRRGEQVAEDQFGFPFEDVLSSIGDGTQDPTTYQQSPPRAPRGETTFYPSGRTIIQLFGKADFSTMLHEMSHVFLEQEFRLSQEKGASEELKADIESINKWFADNGFPVVGGKIPVEAHELFARTGERYFREGKAPSAELRDAFTQFKTWLTGVYKSIKDLLAYGPAPINPEISEIMDRIIATSEAIENNATTPMSQEQLGMTTAEYAAYLGSVADARDAAHDTLLERMMKAIRRREQAQYREQRANIRAEVAEQVNSDPSFIALHLLRTGRWLNEPGREATPIKLHTGWLIDNYGEEALAQLPVGLQPLHRGDGVVGDVVADMVGMSSGDALVQALLDLKSQADQLKADGNTRSLRDQLIEDQTNAIMAERHGDIAMSEEQIEEEAIAALNSSRQGEILAAELRQLRKINNRSGAITPYQLLREWARRKANEGTVGEVSSKTALQRFVRGYNRARNLFEEAILGGNNDEAVKQKQAQMINHALLAEGKIVADEIDTIVRRMNRYARTKAIASIDQDYMDRIHELLEGYNFRTVTDRVRAEQASFEDWAAKQREAGHEVFVPERFRDDRTNWKDAQVAKLLELNDMVQSLAAQGKLKQRLTSAREERELQVELDDAESRILALPPRTLPEGSTGQENRPFRQALRQAKTFADYRAAVGRLFNKQKVREIASGLIKVEGVMDVLDGSKDATGPMNRHVVQRATEAANTFSTLLEEVMDPIIARYRGMSRKQSARLQDFVTINELTLNVSIHEADQEKLGQPLNIPRTRLLGLIANTGNLSNLSKLVAGERWGDPESATDLTRVRDILVGYASKEDLDLVQDMWNSVSKLWPHIVKVEREMSGIVPEEVVPMEFDTPHGPYSGGYWPVVWDRTRSVMGQKQGEEAETSLQGVGFGIGTPKGHTITRTGAAAPMEWSMEAVLFGHINKVISRVAYAPWIRDVLKIVDNPRITGAIRLRLGDEYVKMIKPWIRDQIPSNWHDTQGAVSWEKFLNATRVNMSIAVLGVSYSTGLAQGLGLGYSAGVLGEGSIKAGGKWMSVGLLKTLQLQKNGMKGAQEFVFARSEEMKRRMHETNQEAAEVFRRLKDQDTVYRKLQAGAFWHIG
ncbi:MAG: hypothetical protein M3R04_04625, partial [bacterium]|nr:hypothetical protein [bacterium]